MITKEIVRIANEAYFATSEGTEHIVALRAALEAVATPLAAERDRFAAMLAELSDGAEAVADKLIEAKAERAALLARLAEAEERADHAESFCYRAGQAAGEPPFACAETVPLRARLAELERELDEQMRETGKETILRGCAEGRADALAALVVRNQAALIKALRLLLALRAPKDGDTIESVEDALAEIEAILPKESKP